MKIGFHADNIRQVLAILRDRGFDGVLSMECEGQGGPMIARLPGSARRWRNWGFLKRTADRFVPDGLEDSP